MGKCCPSHKRTQKPTVRPMLLMPLTLSRPRAGGATRPTVGVGGGTSGGGQGRWKPPNRKSKSPSAHAPSGTAVPVIARSPKVEEQADRQWRCPPCFSQRRKSLHAVNRKKLQRGEGPTGLKVSRILGEGSLGFAEEYHSEAREGRIEQISSKIVHPLAKSPSRPTVAALSARRRACSVSNTLFGLVLAIGIVVVVPDLHCFSAVPSHRKRRPATHRQHDVAVLAARRRPVFAALPGLLARLGQQDFDYLGLTNLFETLQVYLGPASIGQG
jgi:hypothetical protein